MSDKVRTDARRALFTQMLDRDLAREAEAARKIELWQEALAALDREEAAEFRK